MAPSQPLSGLTVFELGHSVAAPYAGLILAELGARVVKVENPNGGDYARDWGPPFWKGTATAFHALNRGKESIAVDFSCQRQVRSLRNRIVDEADVVLQNLRPKVLSRHGLDLDELQRDRPQMIICDISAFGATGPLAERPGYDPLMQAFAGIMSVTGEGSGRPPVRVGVSLIDMGAGMWAVIGILANLLARQKSGEGGKTETSLFETGLAWMTVQLAAYAGSGEVRRPFGSATSEIVPYQAFKARNGWLMIAAGNDNLFQRLCHTIGRNDLANDPQYAANRDRVVNRVPLLAEITKTIAAEDLESLTARLDEAGVPNAPLQTSDQVFAHAQTRALKMIEPAEGDSLPLTGIPIRLGGSRPRTRSSAPSLGEHAMDDRRKAKDV